VLAAWAALQHEPPPELLQRLWGRSQRALRALSPEQLLRLAGSLAALPGAPPRPWLQACRQLLLAKCCACEPPHLFGLLPALAAVSGAAGGHRRSGDVPGLPLPPLCPGGGPQGARQGALEPLGPQQQQQLQQHFQQLQQQLPAATPPQLAGLLQAMHQLPASPPPQLLRQLQWAAVQQLALLRAEDLLQAFEALLAMGARPSTRESELLLRRLHALLPRMTGAQAGAGRRGMGAGEWGPEAHGLAPGRCCRSAVHGAAWPRRLLQLQPQPPAAAASAAAGQRPRVACA
jgi:hypothetical protein